MNKKTLYFLGVVGAVVVVAISIQRGKSPHAEPLSPSAASKPAVRPSVPVSRPPANIVVRAVETRQADEMDSVVVFPRISAKQGEFPRTSSAANRWKFILLQKSL